MLHRLPNGSHIEPAEVTGIQFYGMGDPAATSPPRIVVERRSNPTSVVVCRFATDQSARDCADELAALVNAAKAKEPPPTDATHADLAGLTRQCERIASTLADVLEWAKKRWGR
jgi:hypothetical protein